MTKENITYLVARYFKIEFKILISKTRNGKIKDARQIAMYLCTQYTSETLLEIGKYFGGKNYATVLHARNRIKNLIHIYKDVELNVSILKNKINAYNSKIKETSMGTTTQIWKTRRSLCNNELLPVARVAQCQEPLHCTSPIVRRMFTKQQNSSGKSGGPYTANKPIRSLQYYEREIRRMFRRRKLSIPV